MTPEQFEKKWHQKLVKPIDHYNIPIKEYFVTAALLDEDGCAKWAIMATDYSLENKQWITFDLAPKEVELLEDRFEILGDYNNIESESIQEVIGTEMIGGEEHIIVNVFRWPEKEHFQTKIPRNSTGWPVGSKSYLFLYQATTGERRTMGFNLENRKHESNELIYENMVQVRSWIKSGLYHLGNPQFKQD